MNYDTEKVMHLAGFTDRLLAAGLSRWELGDLLGIHPHELSEADLADLAERPVRVLIELARRLDMHPADLVYELDQVLSNPRIPPPASPLAPPADQPQPQPAPDPEADARVLVAALATAPHPITLDNCAHALSWPLPRAHTALDTLRHNPDLAGPMAIRYEPPDAYTLTPRLDLLTTDQLKELATRRPRFDILGRDQAAALYTVITTGYQDGYATHPKRDQDQEHRLRQAGLIHGDADRGEPVYAIDDVLFSLRRTGPRRSLRWEPVHQRRLAAAQALAAAAAANQAKATTELLTDTEAAERARQQLWQRVRERTAGGHVVPEPTRELGDEAIDLTPYDAWEGQPVVGDRAAALSRGEPRDRHR